MLFQPVGRGTTALRYLARYVRRSAFSAKRLLGYDARGDVRLLWKSSATRRRQGYGGQAGKTAVLTLHPHEKHRRPVGVLDGARRVKPREAGLNQFIRRWLIHVLPKGFPRVRHYGFLSPAAGKTRLRVRALLGQPGEPPPQLPAVEPFACPHCGGELSYLRDIAPIRIPRGPPRKIQAPA